MQQTKGFWLATHGPKILGYLAIALLNIALLVTALNISIALLTQHHIKVPNIHVLKELQRFFYFNGFVDIWQFKTDCAKSDDQLIYRPKIGECHFSNIEFETTINFNALGRQTGSTIGNNNNAIAVLGDSHAMGWGVNDAQTFSAVLEDELDRTVYNLGVSSYATERELMLFSEHPEIESIETVIIQYSYNDYSSNSKFPLDIDLGLTRYSSASEIYEPYRSSTLPRSILSSYGVFFRALLPGISPDARLLSERYSGTEPDHVEGILRVLSAYTDILSGKDIYVFYVNSHGQTDSSFNGWVQDRNLNDIHIKFVELSFEDNHFFQIDDHLNVSGHESVGRQLSSIIQ